jgi:hypothetical protein
MSAGEFCAHESHEVGALPADPYDEDGYCCWCGNGRWKHHTPDCDWADARDAAEGTRQEGLINGD